MHNEVLNKLSLPKGFAWARGHLTVYESKDRYFYTPGGTEGHGAGYTKIHIDRSVREAGQEDGQPTATTLCGEKNLRWAVPADFIDTSELRWCKSCARYFESTIRRPAGGAPSRAVADYDVVSGEASRYNLVALAYHRNGKEYALDKVYPGPRWSWMVDMVLDSVAEELVGEIQAGGAGV